MIPDLLRFHHLGLAASDSGRAVGFLEALGYAIGEEVHDPLQNVNLRMCEQPHAPDVEVITSSGTPGPLDSILQQSRNMIYHTCWVTPNVEDAIMALSAKGIRCTQISEPTPAVLFDQDPVSFYMVRGFGMIEFLESEVRFTG